MPETEIWTIEHGATFEGVHVIRLSWGRYALIERVVYERTGASALHDRHWILEAVDSGATPARRDVPEGSVRFTVVGASAAYRGARLDDLVFYADDTVGFRVWTDRRGDFPSWPEGVLRDYSGGHHPGDNYWEGRIALSELEDFQDDVPDEWRPFLPDGSATFRKDYDRA